uniref:NAD-dependent epimerase/dehydratase family protein n=1 Tax=Polynucleobacter sp. TaxID=2029855 RepID=UPI0040482D6A
MESEKVLIIGGAGFMGSHTADELSRRGYSVTIFDKVASPWLRPDQQMVVADLMDYDALLCAMKDARYVYHYAGVADIGEAKLNPSKTIEANIMGIARVMELAVKVGVKRFAYASTMYVYSVNGSFYRASKQAAEILIEVYAEEYGIEFTLLRYGSLYGPRAQPWNGIRKFITQIIKEGRFDYLGNGTEMREYIHAFDAARLSVDILDPKHANQAITITGQQLIRVDQLAAIIFEIAGVQPNIQFKSELTHPDHYGQTPYRYKPLSAKKLVPTEFVDLGQGILNVIDEIHQEIDAGEN